MSETNVQITAQNEPLPARQRKAKDETGSKLSWGIFLILAGVALFAREMGWLNLSLGWLLPAILVAIGTGYLYEAFKKKQG